MSTVGVYREYRGGAQYPGGTIVFYLSTPMVLMISPHVSSYPPMVLMISPMVPKTPHGTEHTLYKVNYWVSPKKL